MWNERESSRFRQVRPVAIATVGLVVFMLVVGLPAFKELQQLSEVGRAGSSIAVLSVLGLLATAGVLLQYLTPLSSEDRTTPLLRDEHVQELVSEAIDRRLSDLDVLVRTAQSPDDWRDISIKRDDVVAIMRQHLDAAAVVEALDRATSRDDRDVQRVERELQFGKVSQRLRLEVLELGRRGAVNLVLGMSMALTGIGVLAWGVHTKPITKDLTELMSHLLPNVGLGLLVQLFALFFLRLYKESIGGIKYFQNEQTNIELRHLALEAALNGSDPVVQKSVIENLAGTERNFLLNQGQSTVEIEKERMQRSADQGVLDQIKQMVRRDKDSK